MSPFCPDIDHTPSPVRVARPLIEAFIHTEHCPPEHQWHARSTLPVLALFVAMTTESNSFALAWEAIDPEELMSRSLDAEVRELGFLRDLLAVSAHFYLFLGECGVVDEVVGRRVHKQLMRLALGLTGNALRLPVVV